MGDVVNLRQARKAKRRADKERTADENRARFGAPKRERLAASAELSRSEARLDGHRREPARDE